MKGPLLMSKLSTKDPMQKVREAIEEAANAMAANRLQEMISQITNSRIQNSSEKPTKRKRRKQKSRASETISKNASEEKSMSARVALVKCFNSRIRQYLTKAEIQEYVSEQRGVPFDDGYYYSLTSKMVSEGLIERKDGMYRATSRIPLSSE
jgi:hypothetical protein